MNSKSNKKTKPLQVRSKTNRLPSWLNYLVSLVYELSLFNILAITLALLFVVGRGKLFSKDGLILSLVILIFLILLFVRNKLNKEDNH
jgi:hypothetical protein